MNPSPDRNNEVLPPKKRESRQCSSHQPAPEDDFKSPAPFRSRRHLYSTEGHRESRDILSPMLPPLPLSLPWQVSYPPSMHHSFLPVQVGERQRSSSGSWRETFCGRGTDVGLAHTIPHQCHWLSSDVTPISVQPLMSAPTFKSVQTDSQEIWSYGPSQRDYSSSVFSPHLFQQPTVYSHDSKLRYQGRCPNGVDGPGTRSGNTRRVPLYNDCVNASVTRLDGGPHSNDRRKQENTTRQTPERGLLPQESISAVSSPWDRDPWGRPKAEMPISSDTKTGKAVTSQDHFGVSASQTGAQIYYALGSLCPLAQQNPKEFPQISSSVSCSLGNSKYSPQTQHSHTVVAEWDPSAGSYQPPVAVLTGPDPLTSAVLPHFAKGSLIELAGGHLKRVEELKTEDFLRSADTLPEFHLSTCTILLISAGPTYGFNHLQVLLTDRNSQELLTVLAEYPFFVRDRGWSSCSPHRSAQLYGLQCHQLSKGDVCLALTPTPVSPHSVAALAHSSSKVQHSGAVVECKELVERVVPLPAPPSAPVFQPSPSNSLCERPRKRRWSAPEFEPGFKTGSHLSQGSEQ